MTFYLRMAWRSLLRSRGLTLVMIAALSLGVGTWYLQHQIFTFLDGKNPAAPAHVYSVLLERGDLEPASRPGIVAPLIPSILLTPRDAVAVIAGAKHRRVITFGAPALVEPPRGPAETARVRYTTRDLFSLFDIPLAAGEPWSPAADAGLFEGTPVPEAVIAEALADRAFGGAPAALGQTLRVDGIDVRVVGVVSAAHFTRYHLYERFVPRFDAVYLPLAHATAARVEPDFQHAIAGGESGSASVWVELPAPSDRASFLAAAEGHLAHERARGRVETPRSVRLRSSDEWRQAFLPGGTINLWPLLSAMCLVTSIVNLIRMLIAKFSGRGHDLGLLRAFGARRREVMGQLLLEAVLIGLVAGICGIGLGIAMMPIAAGTLKHLSGTPDLITASAVVTTLGASIGAALIAALYPAWRLSRGTPAAQLRRK